MATPSTITKLLEAIEFSADKHRKGKRKDEDGTPYINHPIRVAALLAEVGGVEDVELLQAGILHDTIEDGGATSTELAELFGEKVRKWVVEVSDDKALKKKQRKQLQVDTAGRLSREAQMIRVADKIANLEDIAAHPPRDWSKKRKRKYVDWATEVVRKCRKCPAPLKQKFVKVRDELQATLGGKA